MHNPVFCDGLSMPEGPVALSSGDIAIVEMGEARKSVSVASSGGGARILCQIGGNPNGLAIDGDGCFWIAGGPNQSLARIDPDGRLIGLVDGDGKRPFLFPNDVAFGPNGMLYLTDSGISPTEMARGNFASDFAGRDYQGAVYQIDPVACRVLEKIAGDLRFTNGLAFDPAGRLCFNETLTGLVYRLDAQGRAGPFANVLSTPISSFKGPDGMAFGTDGTLYCTVLGEGHICVVAPDGTVLERLGTNGSLPTNVAFDAERDVLYVTEIEHGAIEIIAVGRRGLALAAPCLGAAR